MSAMTETLLSNPVSSNGKTVLVGLSGGVDSAMSALILKQQGYSVIGVTMSIYEGPVTEGKRNGCYDCGEQDDIESAASFCASHDIPYQVIKCAEQYRKIVLDYFRSEYMAGRTPNPCVRCNQQMKFGVLPSFAADMGLAYDFFATGHYVRSVYSPEYERHVLMRGLDPKKDQSYFLYRLKTEQLAKSIFPLGGVQKTQVRKLAQEFGLPMHDKPDSQDFYGGDKADLMETPIVAGNIVDTNGKVLGRHNGYWNYTPGQRKGLRIAASAPLYVLRTDPQRNEVIVGTQLESQNKGCSVSDLHFTLPEPRAGETYQARMRSSQALFSVRIDRIGSDEMNVEFEEAQQGVAPGQSLVLYQDDIVVGGGIISAAL